MQKARPSGIRFSCKEKRMAEFRRIRFGFLLSLPPASLASSLLSLRIHVARRPENNQSGSKIRGRVSKTVSLLFV